MAMEPIAEGERWAYRKGQLPFEEATILKVVSQSGHRKVRVQFEDGPNAGETQWVGRQYLKAPWLDRQAFVEREQCWARAKSQAWNEPASVREAAALVITETMDDALAIDRSHGILQTSNVYTLAEFAQVTPRELLSSGGFAEEGYTYLPWPIMKSVAIAKCKTAPAAVLDMIERETDSWGQSAVETGYYKPLSKGTVLDLDQPFPEYETQKLAWDVIRRWCGEPALEQWSELALLRAEHARLLNILENALVHLDKSGESYHAARLRGEAGRAFSKPPDWIKKLYI